MELMHYFMNCTCGVNNAQVDTKKMSWLILQLTSIWGGGRVQLRVRVKVRVRIVKLHRLQNQRIFWYNMSNTNCVNDDNIDYFSHAYPVILCVPLRSTVSSPQVTVAVIGVSNKGRGVSCRYRYK